MEKVMVYGTNTSSKIHSDEDPDVRFGIGAYSQIYGVRTSTVLSQIPPYQCVLKHEVVRRKGGGRMRRSGIDRY